MDAELLFLLESSADESDENTQRLVRRRLRDKSNPLSLPSKAYVVEAAAIVHKIIFLCNLGLLKDFGSTKRLLIMF